MDNKYKTARFVNKLLNITPYKLIIIIIIPLIICVIKKIIEYFQNKHKENNDKILEGIQPTINKYKAIYKNDYTMLNTQLTNLYKKHNYSTHTNIIYIALNCLVSIFVLFFTHTYVNQNTLNMIDNIFNQFNQKNICKDINTKIEKKFEPIKKVIKEIEQIKNDLKNKNNNVKEQQNDDKVKQLQNDLQQYVQTLKNIERDNNLVEISNDQQQEISKIIDDELQKVQIFNSKTHDFPYAIKFPLYNYINNDLIKKQYTEDEDEEKEKIRNRFYYRQYKNIIANCYNATNAIKEYQKNTKINIILMLIVLFTSLNCIYNNPYKAQQATNNDDDKNDDNNVFERETELIFQLLLQVAISIIQYVSGNTIYHIYMLINLIFSIICDFTKKIINNYLNKKQ